MGGIDEQAEKIWIGCGIVALLAIVVIASINSSRRNTVLVQTAKVKKKDVLTSKITASGEIRAKEFVDLQSEIAGIITDIPVREGAAVKRGDVLLRIDPIQTEADALARRAQYEAALAEVRSQEFVIQNAEANLLRDEASSDRHAPNCSSREQFPPHAEQLQAPAAAQ